MMSGANHCFAVLAYKESPYLESCIESLLNQNLKSEIIVCTATPNDYIQKTAEKYNLKLFVNSQKPGIATDWSYAYQCAGTQYVTLSHQDDIYCPDYTAKMLEAAQSEKSNLITFCDYSELRGEKEVKSNMNLLIKRVILYTFFPLMRHIRQGFLKKYFLSAGSPISCPTVMYNKKNLGNFSFSDEYKINLDWDAWLRLAGTEGAFTFVKEILVKHRVHEESETSSGIRDGIRQAEDLKLFSRIWPSLLAAQISKVYALSYLSNK